MTEYRVEVESCSGPYTCRDAAGGEPWSGVSRHPLLDACRRLRAMGVPLRGEIRLYWHGRDDWALRTTVGYGCGLTVTEDSTGGPYFGKYHPGPRQRARA